MIDANVEPALKAWDNVKEQGVHFQQRLGRYQLIRNTMQTLGEPLTGDQMIVGLQAVMQQAALLKQTINILETIVTSPTPVDN